MLNKVKKRVVNTIFNIENYPLLIGLAAGLFPMLHYYNHNLTMANTWRQFASFIGIYILLPIGIVFFINRFSKFFKSINVKLWLTITNTVLFGFYVAITLYGFSAKHIIILVVVGIIAGIVLYKSLAKIIIIELLLAGMSLVALIPDFYKYITFSDAWLAQPDDILNVNFKTKPNVYVIQPDGYVNFSEISKGYYNFDNNEFKAFLEANHFKLYSEFRSNYQFTLLSNASLFGMKHHYCSDNKNKLELLKERQYIVSENPVLSIFKANNFKTHLLTENPYFLLNKPKIGFDYSNYKLEEIPFLSRGFDRSKEIIPELTQILKRDTLTPKFFFIEKYLPGHITGGHSGLLSKESERKRYLSRLKQANLWLKDMIQTIESLDKNSLIVILADHGGYIGYEYTLQTQIKPEVIDEDLTHSTYSTLLAIKWPNNNPPDFDTKLRSNVNLFRILFSYLGKNKNYLKHLQEDKSYLTLKENTSYKVYELIDEDYNAVLKPLKK